MKKIKKIVLALVLLMATSVLFANGQKEVVKEVPTLIWYLPGGSGFPYQDDDEVYAKLNEMLVADLGVKVDFRATGQFGDFKETMPLAMMAGEKFDIVWTAHWNNPFLPAANDGYYAGLDDLLKEHAPTIWKDTSSAMEALRVDGQIRGVWSQQIAAKTSNFMLRDRMIEDYGWDVSKVKTLRDLEPLLADIKANESDVIPLSTRKSTATWMRQSLGFDELSILAEILAVDVNDKNAKIFNVLDNKKYNEVIEISREWFEKGYIAKDGLTYNNDQWQSLYNTGKIGIDMHNTYIPGKNIAAQSFGENRIQYPFAGPSVFAGSGITATVNAISSQSKHKVEAVKVLEYFWTNAEAYNLLTWGIEGQHYTMEDGFMNVNKDSGYFTNIPWVFGNTFISYPKVGENPEANGLVYDLNQSATPSPLMGFVLDIEPIKNDVAALVSVVGQYHVAATAGYMGQDILDEYQANLKSAGIDRVITGIQSQINAWLTSK